MNTTRRNFLRATGGAALCVPALESFAADSKPQAPKRLLNLGFIYGVTKYDMWFPKETGKDFDLTPGLKPLERHKNDFTFFSNLINPRHVGAHNNFDRLFSCGRTTGEQGEISFDQIFAREVGKHTRFDSIQIGGREGGGLSYDPQGLVMGGIEDPMRLYDQLFSPPTSVDEATKRIRTEQSVVDLLRRQTDQINGRISKQDRQKLDQYYQSVREIERRLAKEELWLDRGAPKAPLKKPSVKMERGKVHQGVDYVEAMFDLIVAAFQTDSTRVVSMVIPLQSLLTDIGATNNSHAVSHHREKGKTGGFGNASAFDDSVARDKKNAELLAYLIDKMKATKDADGSSLFDNTIISFASGFRNDHNRIGLPVIHAGGKNCGIKHAGYIELNASTGKNLLSNLWLTNLQALGVEKESFGDSVGTLDEVKA